MTFQPEHDNQNLLKRLKELNQQNADLAAENIDLMARMSDQHPTTADFDQLTANNERLQATVTDLTNTNTALINTNEQLLDAKHQIRAEVDNLKAWQFLETRDQGHHYVYELRLADGCYYVGETGDLHERLSSHFKGYNEHGNKSAYWTSKHHPVAIIGLIEFDQATTKTTTIREKETLETLRLMRRYGYQNVRGGCFTAEDDKQLAHFLLKPERQAEFHYQPAELGLKAAESSPDSTEDSIEDTTPVSAAATVPTPASATSASAPADADQTPVELDPDGELKDYLDDPEQKLHRYAAFKRAAPASFAVVVMTNGNQYLIFRRQCKNLVNIFKRLADGDLDLSDDSVSSTSFTHVVQLIILDVDDYPNGSRADDYLDQKITELKKNGSRTVLRETYRS